MTAEEKPKERSLTHQAVAGTAWSALATAGKQVLTFASLATVARMLGPNAYGVMGMAALVIAFINNFRDLGTAIAVIQKQDVSLRLLSSLFWINAGFGVALCVFVMLTAPWVAIFFHTPELSAVLRALSVSFVIASCGVVHSALLNRRMAFRALAIVDITSAAATYLVALVCALRGLGVWSLVFANLTSSTASSAGYWLVEHFLPSLTFDKREVASIARFSANLSGFGLVNYAYRNADNLVVGKVLGSAALGFYSMAYNMMLAPLQNITAVVSQVLFPAFSRIQEDDERFRHAYVRGCMLIGLITFPLMAGLGVLADPVIRAILGPKWLGTIVVFQILAPVGLLQSIQSTTGIIFQAKGRTDWMFRWGLVVLAVCLAAFLIGVRFGLAGVAAGYACAYLGILSYPGFLIPFRLIGLRVRDFARALLPQAAWTGGMAATCVVWLRILNHFAIANPWLRLTSTASLGASVYVVGMLGFRPQVIVYLDEILTSSDNRLIARASRFLAWRRP